MVLRLATALDVPLRPANEMMLAAGYAPVWSETALDAQALAPIRHALDHMLTQQEPFPAVVANSPLECRCRQQGCSRAGRVPCGAASTGGCTQSRHALVAPDGCGRIS